MKPADRDRFEKCLVLAKCGATAGERAAANAAAERIAASAGMTLSEATAWAQSARLSTSGAAWTWSWPHSASRPRRPHPRSKPKKPAKSTTVEERLRQKAEIEAERRRATAAADRKLVKELEEQAAYERSSARCRLSVIGSGRRRVQARCRSVAANPPSASGLRDRPRTGPLDASVTYEVQLSRRREDAYVIRPSSGDNRS